MYLPNICIKKHMLGHYYSSVINSETQLICLNVTNCTIKKNLYFFLPVFNLLHCPKLTCDGKILSNI